MYCEYHEEYDMDCEECDRSQNCKQFANAQKVEADREKFRDSAFGETVRTQFKAQFNLNDEVLDKIIIELTDKALNISLNEVRQAVKDMAAIEARKYIDGRAKTVLDGYFEASLNDEIRMLDKNDKSMTKKISDILLERAKSFFHTESSNRRNYMEETLDKCMMKVINEKVDEAIKELKEECIEKFNKDILKTMMEGMVGAIKMDKRLMAVINSQE